MLSLLHRPSGRLLRHHLCCTERLDVRFFSPFFRTHSFIPSSYQLAVVNDGIIDDTCNNLVPGQSICLGWTGEDCTTTYVVGFNDDCDIVAAAYGINTTTLYNNNPQLNAECTNLYVGEVSFFSPLSGHVLMFAINRSFASPPPSRFLPCLLVLSLLQPSPPPRILPHPLFPGATRLDQDSSRLLYSL